MFRISPIFNFIAVSFTLASNSACSARDHLGLVAAAKENPQRENFARAIHGINTKTFSSNDHPGKVASIMIIDRLNSIAKELKDQKSDILPHELKDFRKELGNLKILTDIFIFSFPKTEKKDPLLDFREDLDEGYLVAGEFKDLFDRKGLTLAVKNPENGQWSTGTRPSDIDYPKDQLKEKRQAYLNWAQKFEKNDKQEELYEYFSHPILSGMEMRKQKDISRMYWGGLGTWPSSESNLKEYLSLLIRQLTEVLADDYIKILPIEDITHDEVAFHDVRKRMRSLVKIHSFFKHQMDPSQILSEPMDLFATIAANFGAIHDKMIGLESLPKKERENRSQDIKSLWKKEKQRLGDLDVLGALEAVKEFLEIR